MEESVLPLTTILTTPSDSFMDLDYIDELLLEGCWLEANGSEFSRFDTSTPISPFEPSFFWPTLESNNNIIESSSAPSKNNQDERQRSSFPENLSISQSHLENISKPEAYSLEASKKWWIGPRASTSVMDRLIQALSYIKDFSRDKDILIQVWVPVNRGGKRVLTTNDQPFLLDLNCCPRLAHYRDISVNYQFSAEEDSREVVGLPGRVFRSKVPEWTPDVRFFTQDEYPRVGHAQQYDVRGTLAVPVLEQGSRSCLGVIEVVLTTQKIKYRPELESVCKALEAVDLTSSEGPTTQNVKTRDLSYQAALPEILKVLKSACETHGLPLAQTWVPCTVQGKGGCRHSDDNLENCISPVESACHIGDPHVQGFHEACSEYHLLKGQGIIGKAFRTNQPCFSPDVTACSKTEYPLSHHARMFGLKSGVAIRLRSIYTGTADFVLEFFLPMNCTDPEEQRKMLTSLSTIIQNVCCTLRVVTEKELQEESSLLDKASQIDHMQFSRPYSSHNESGNSREILAEASEDRLGQGDSNSREDVTFITNPSTSGDGSSLYTKKTGEKRRIKAEKTITLQVLRQHFAGSLKDAARNLGVCPTTLKRICRQHGIQRWPSRKIKKVGHSLQKIQRVIDSVQGTSGILHIESFYSNFPELASPNASRTTQFSISQPTDNLNPLDEQPENGVSRPPAAASVSPSSSCSQNSSSSQCYSSGTQPNSYTFSFPAHEDSVVKEEPVHGVLKRARSDANLHFFSDGPKLLPRSQSHVSFYEPAKQENLPPAPEPGFRESRERDAPRIKVTYGEDTIRFRMQNNWGYKDLLREISRRFGVDNAAGFHLKYLDDDAEWVLLTCDADLEECIDVCCSSRSHTIKLCFLRDSQTQFGRSFGIISGSL
ncbi:hypothetical protein BUALT_Bualt15G0135000 [Buddleja alternifolia]|uniref:Uncharacterized protein n=1 Tax=Buddleja alternifolia TaxID=168488 RepID=A0AAV6WQJ9_9LAMI|nr:hypothetical protein BUALT_Bualt15G0135000 [Buddleja alternifolia]